MFIPATTVPPQPSAQAEDLGRRLADSARDYLAAHPGMQRDELLQAFDLAERDLRGDSSTPRRATVAFLALGTLFLGLGVAFFLAQGVSVEFEPVAMIWILPVLIAGIFLLARTTRRRRRRRVDRLR